MTERWTPLLDEPPEIADVLLDALRRVLPTVFDAAVQEPQRATRAVAAAMSAATVSARPATRLTITGRDLRRADHGRRDALHLAFSGDARFRAGTVTVRGDAVLDLATNGLLRLRLIEPVSA